MLNTDLFFDHSNPHKYKIEITPTDNTYTYPNTYDIDRGQNLISFVIVKYSNSFIQINSISILLTFFDTDKYHFQVSSICEKPYDFFSVEIDFCIKYGP